MTYDGLLRLTSVTTTNAESFTLDGASNVASRTGPSAAYSYDTADRLTGDGAQTFTWSDADRLTARGADTFSYDALDRLTGSTVSGTARTYAYDGDGLLQSRTQGTATSFLWDPATAPSRLLMQGPDKIVYGLGPLYVVKGDGSTVALARDGGKSVRAELTSAGAVTASFRYGAYGQAVQSFGSASFDTVSRSVRYHFQKHGAEVGARDVLEYTAMAQDFWRSQSYRGRALSCMTRAGAGSWPTPASPCSSARSATYTRSLPHDDRCGRSASPRRRSRDAAPRQRPRPVRR